MKSNPYPGIFIVLEGIDRSGKHTQAAYVQKYLEQQGLNVLLTQEPWWGHDQKLRRIIKQGKGTATPLEIQKLFVQNRAEHLARQIIPHLKKDSHNVVLCVRYFLSTLAYGVSTGGGTTEQLLQLHETIPEFFVPDLTVILDVPVAIALGRVEGTSEVFEKDKILRDVQKNYYMLANRFGYDTNVVIDAAKIPSAVFASLIPYLEKALRAKKEDAYAAIS